MEVSDAYAFELFDWLDSESLGSLGFGPVYLTAVVFAALEAKQGQRLLYQHGAQLFAVAAEDEAPAQETACTCSWAFVTCQAVPATFQLTCCSYILTVMGLGSLFART